ncbi:MAG: TlpA disulfide reductase family protein [Bacteroidota bacterium]|nr:TlpA disulfide reductase family protein [Bacteroidota bacterium]
MSRLIFFSFLVFSLAGCVEKQGAKTENEDSTNHEVVEDEVNGRIDVNFPVYDFEEFEPMLHRNDGNTYIVNFWATWCKPCLEEMPFFERINAAYKNHNVKVVLVNLDMPHMWKKRLEPYVENKDIASEVVILDDPKQKEWIPKVSADWSGGIPATLIYNKDKRAFYEHGFSFEQLDAEVNKFIGQ